MPDFIAEHPKAAPHPKNTCRPPRKAFHEGGIPVTAADTDEKTVELSASCQERDLLLHRLQVSAGGARKQDEHLRDCGVGGAGAADSIQARPGERKGKAGGGRWAPVLCEPALHKLWVGERGCVGVKIRVADDLLTQSTRMDL